MRLTQANIHGEFLRAGELQAAGRYGEAADLWREIVAAAPQSPEARSNLGSTLLALGRIDEAEAAARAAVALAPDAHGPRYQLGRLLGVIGRPQEGATELQAALALKPDDARTRLDLGYLKLASGDLAGGWPLYQARADVPGQGARRLPRPGEWKGEPLAGKSILLWPEQGFGDQIQFARFASVLRDRGARVVLAAPAELVALFAGLGVEVVDAAGPLPETDHWSLMLSVPRWLGTTLETLPSAPYLAAPAERRARWAGKVPTGAVGVAWRGRPTHANDAHRSLPSRDLLAPLEAAGARLFDLQAPRGDFADLAAVVEQLDLVVTVDTALAHLAGALGRPCWVLLPWYRTDWRWLTGRSDSPWYPSVRLFRQPAFGDWEGAIAAVVRAYSEFR
jgi:hypothetical protein